MTLKKKNKHTCEDDIIFADILANQIFINQKGIRHAGIYLFNCPLKVI